MKIIEPKVEYLPQSSGLTGIWDQIARATRVSYQSSAREGENSEDFVKRVILKPALIEGDLNDLKSCKFNFDAMHGSCLEHGTVYLALPTDTIIPINANRWAQYRINPYSDGGTICEVNGERRVATTSNMRVLFENGWLEDLQYLCNPTPYHQRRYTFSVITDIGVSREANRTRKFSITEQSTRYCCFNADKFGGEITYVKPAWESKDKPLVGGPFADMSDEALFQRLLTDIKNGFNTQWTAKTYYIFGLLASEFAYMGMRNNGEVADKCRQVLNLNTKTQVVYTAFAKDWEHFLKLRADNVSGKAHENIQIIAKKIKDIIEHF